LGTVIVVSLAMKSDDFSDDIGKKNTLEN